MYEYLEEWICTLIWDKFLELEFWVKEYEFFHTTVVVSLLSHIWCFFKITRLLSPWDFTGKNTGVGYHFLFQGIFPTQRSNQYLLLGRWILHHWAIWEALCILEILLNCPQKRLLFCTHSLYRIGYTIFKSLPIKQW